ncbi:MAG TPA: terminase, partial [Acidobacteriaceae bacterium]
MASKRLGEVDALREMGRRMDRRPGLLIEAAEKILCIRTREGQLRRLLANPAQRAFEERRGRQNIVLKARQMGITTWVSARFFLRT